MKVSFVTGWDTEKDGISDYSRYLVEGLKKNNIDVQIVKLGYYIEEKLYYKKIAEEANKSDLCHIQFNYVYFNGWLPYRNRFAYFLKYLKIPAVITFHELVIERDSITSGIDNKIKKYIFNNSLRILNLWSEIYHKNIFNKANKILVHTKEQQVKIKTSIKNADKVYLIPHGIPEISKEDKNISASHAKKQLGMDNKTVLTIFGFINKRKGYENVIEILHRLPEDVILLIAGGSMTDNLVDSGYYNLLQNKIASRGLSKRIRITGYLKPNEIPVIMAATDICLAPFFSPAASGAVSLSIAFNKAIIASDIAVNKEINERYPCLELYKYSDNEDLLEKIVNLLNDKERQMQLKQLAEEYTKKFNFSAIVEGIIKLYEEK